MARAVIEQPREFGGVTVRGGGNGEVGVAPRDRGGLEEKPAGAHQHEGCEAWVRVRAHLARGLAPAQRLDHQREVARHLAAPEHLERTGRPLEHLPHDQPHRALHPGEPLDVRCGERTQAGLGLALGVEQRHDLLAKAGDRVCDQCLVQPALAAEVVKHRRLADAGGSGNVGHRSPGVAAPREEPTGGCRDAPLALGPCLSASRRGGHARSLSLTDRSVSSGAAQPPTYSRAGQTPAGRHQCGKILKTTDG